MAAQCDETAHLTAGERKARSSAKLVHPDRLADAVARYMDYEALAYWARPALEQQCRASCGSCRRGGTPMPRILGHPANNTRKGAQRFCARLGAPDALDRRPPLPRCANKKVGSMPSSSECAAIHVRYEQWNLPTTATMSGNRYRPSPTRCLRNGAGMPILTLTSTTNRSTSPWVLGILEESRSNCSTRQPRWRDVGLSWPWSGRP